MTEAEARALTIGAAVKDNGPGVGTVVEKHIDFLSIKWTAPPTRVEGVSTFFYEDMELISSAGPTYGAAERMLSAITPTNTVPGSYTVGNQFTVNAEGRITHIRYWHASGCGGFTHPLAIWNTGGTKVASAVDTAADAFVGMREIALATPLVVLAGQNYTVSYATGGFNYGFSGSATSLAPHLTLGLGFFGAGIPESFPSNPGGTVQYHADVVYEPKV